MTPIVHARFVAESPTPTELLLADNGAKTSGKYLIRRKPKSTNAIVSVIYKGAPTHHTIALSEDDGMLTINKSSTGASSLVEVGQSLACYFYAHTKPPIALPGSLCHPTELCAPTARPNCKRIKGQY